MIQVKHFFSNRYSIIFTVLFIVGSFGVPSFLLFHAHAQKAASLFVSPTGGTFTVGSTFTVSVYMNTEGNSVNAIDAILQFPPNKLQVVSPTAGKSLIRVWINQPTYDNQSGIIRFQGGVPNPGINTSQGVVSQVTFRAVSLGSAIVKFADESRILLNDGRGTDVLGQTTSGIYSLVLPPPAGPIVSSPTHPDQERWYSNNTVSLEWSHDERISAYSYILSDDPVDFPDDISEGEKTYQVYKNLADGIHYFHIKALRNGSWGGVTHFALKIDTSPPAKFPVDITPASITTTQRPAIHFATTDILSGVDHYEVQIVSLTPPSDDTSEQKQSFFIEAGSPYVPELNFGSYDVIVRAYDQAGNYDQESGHLQIVTAAFDIIRHQGIKIRSNIIVPWAWIVGIAGIILVILILVAIRFRKKHYEVTHGLSTGALPPEVQRQLEELKKFKEKYKNAGVLVVLLCMSAALFLGGTRVYGAEKTELSPPIIDVFSSHISNQEIFYIGGRTDTPNSKVVIYIQSLEDGSTLSASATPDSNGGWFYSHPTFLSSGEYLLWTQDRAGETLSPPSSQVKLSVSRVAVQFGASRLSYEAIYLAISLLLLLTIIVFGCIAYYHRRNALKKHAKLLEEVQRAEETVRRGFALLRRDLEHEFHLIQKAKFSRELSREEQEMEEKITNDLEGLKSYLGKDIWNIEQEI